MSKNLKAKLNHVIFPINLLISRIFFVQNQKLEIQKSVPSFPYLPEFIVYDSLED